MKSKTKTASTQKSDNTIDAYSRRRIDQSTGNVRDMLAKNPFQPYEGPRVADLNATQGAARDILAQPAGQDFLTEAADRVRMAGGREAPEVTARTIAGADLDPYMNPYMDQVVERTIADMTRSKDIADNRLSGQLTKSGAFGGDREAILRGEQARGFDDVMASTVANLRSGGFDRAMTLAGSDVDRQNMADGTNAQFRFATDGANDQTDMQVGQILANLGLAEGGEERARANLLNMFGTQEQATEQAGLDADFMEFLRGDEDTFRRIAIEMGLLSGTPVIVDNASRGTQTQTQSDPMAAIGALLGGAGAVASGGGLGAFFSDRRLKTNVVPLGEALGVNWYAYDIFGRREVGVMAQELAETRPDLVHVHKPSGFLMVDYGGLL